MSVVYTWTVPSVRASRPHGRSLKVCMSPEDGSTKDLTLLISIIDPRSMTHYHAHEESGELIYIVTGRGEAIIEGKSHRIEPDTAVYAPLGVRHQIKNLSDETMKLVCVFVPPLPRQYIESIPKEE